MVAWEQEELKQGIEKDCIPQPMSGLSSLELANTLAGLLEDKKAQDIKVVDLQGKSDICDYFVLATGTSTTHVRSLASDLEYQTGLREISPYHVDGRGGNTWMVLDYTSVMVHIFTKETREFYHLDRLYRDLVSTDLDQ